MGQTNDLRAALTTTLAVVQAVREMDDPKQADAALAGLEDLLTDLAPQVDPAIKSSS